MESNNDPKESNEFNVMKFKVGDKVRCIEGISIEDGGPKKGEIFTVKSSDNAWIGFELSRLQSNFYSNDIINGLNTNWGSDSFELVNDLQTIIDTANKGLEAISVLCNEHSDNEKLHYTYAGFDGNTVKFKSAHLMRQGKPARVFLKEEPKFHLGGVKYSLVDAKEIKRQIDSFLEENK